MENLSSLESTPQLQTVADLALKYPKIAEYLETSASFYSKQEIPLTKAVYDKEKRELSFEMDVPEWVQAWEGYSHGGYEVIMLDAANAVAFMESVEMNKGVSTKDLKVTFRLPLKLGTHIKVTGKIFSTEGNKIEVSSWISEINDERERVYVRATSDMRTFDFQS